MRRTVTSKDGQVRCPHCGASNSFVSKRTVKGKVAFGLFAPKRLRCNGCGRMVKP